MKTILLYAQSLLYFFAGINHFRKPLVYTNIIPEWIPWHTEFVYITGVVEILSGILLLIPFTRRWAAWSIIVLLIVVFPANIQMAIDYSCRHDDHAWLTILRLPLQLLLIGMAWLFAKK